jgi:pilus assembly protein CpaF
LCSAPIRNRPSSSVPAAEAVAADKEKKRKERLTELKVEIHKRLLEDLNLSALESATEQNARGARSPSLTSEALDEMSVALNKEDRQRSTRNFTTRSWALVRSSRC